MSSKKPKNPEDWNASYSKGDTPWDSGEPCLELRDVLKSLGLKRGLALDLGCGSGTNSIYLAREGFSVTAVDISQVALKKAKTKAIEAGVDIRFIEATLPEFDISKYSFLEESFDFVFDRGCFHVMDASLREPYSSLVAGFLKKGGLYLVLTGNAREPRSPGPPVLTEKEIHAVFEKNFEIFQMRDFRFAGQGEGNDALGHSCLMRKR